MFVLPVLDLQSPGKLSTSTHNGKKHPGAWMHKLQTLIQGLDFSSSWGREKRFKFIEMGNCKRIHVSVQYLCILCFSSQMVYERRLKVQGVKRPRYGQFVSITTPIPVYVLSLINLKKTSHHDLPTLSLLVQTENQHGQNPTSHRTTKIRVQWW
jgi:hypothetical protein